MSQLAPACPVCGDHPYSSQNPEEWGLRTPKFTGEEQGAWAMLRPPG